MKQAPTVMTTCEAARALGLTPAAVRLMERSGRLLAERTETGTRLFLRADVLRVAELRRACRRGTVTGLQPDAAR